MKLKLIAAVASNGVIGKNNALPWHLPEDLAFFKKTTLGKPIVMGRKTWDSIGRPLPGRLNVILTRDSAWRPTPEKPLEPGQVVIYPTPITADTKVAIAPNPEVLKNWLVKTPEVFLIGGANLYGQVLAGEVIDELILTEIQHPFEGDAYFPTWDTSQFKEAERVSNPPTETRDWGFDFVRYVKTPTKGVSNDTHGELHQAR